MGLAERSTQRFPGVGWIVSPPALAGCEYVNPCAIPWRATTAGGAEVQAGGSSGVFP